MSISRGPHIAETQSWRSYIVFRLRYVAVVFRLYCAARTFYEFDPNASIILNLYLTGSWGWKLRVQQGLDPLYQMLPLFLK